MRSRRRSERESGQVNGSIDLGSEDFEVDASGLVVQPFGDQGGEAQLFQFQITAGHARCEGWGAAQPAGRAGRGRRQKPFGLPGL